MVLDNFCIQKLWRDLTYKYSENLCFKIKFYTIYFKSWEYNHKPNPNIPQKCPFKTWSGVENSIPVHFGVETWSITVEMKCVIWLSRKMYIQNRWSDTSKIKITQTNYAFELELPLEQFLLVLFRGLHIYYPLDDGWLYY